MRPTKEEYRQHLISGIGEQCLVCDSAPISGGWTDYNGELRCRCGACYQILGDHLTDEFKKEMNLTKGDIAKQYCSDFEFIPVYREYWQETHSPLPIGCYLGRPPWDKEQARRWRVWLDSNSDRLRDEYPEFNWDGIRKWCEENSSTEVGAGI